MGVTTSLVVVVAMVVVVLVAVERTSYSRKMVLREVSEEKTRWRGVEMLELFLLFHHRHRHRSGPGSRDNACVSERGCCCRTVRSELSMGFRALAFVLRSGGGLLLGQIKVSCLVGIQHDSVSNSASASSLIPGSSAE